MCMAGYCFNVDFTVCYFGGYGLPCPYVLPTGGGGPPIPAVSPPNIIARNNSLCYLYNVSYNYC